MFYRLGLIATSALALSACTYSTYGAGDERSVSGEGLVASSNIDVPGDASFEGMMVGVDGSVGRDLYMAGASVRGHADVGRNLTAEGARVRFRGDVGGDAEIAAATAHLDADIAGDLLIQGARFTVEGVVQGTTEAQGAFMFFEGDFLGPVTIAGAGDDESGEATLSGRFLAGGEICATEIEIDRNAQFQGQYAFISEREPAGLPDGASFELLDGRDCDRLIGSF